MNPGTESLVLQLLRDMRAKIGDMRAQMATKSDISELRSGVNSLRADIASDFMEMRRELGSLRKDLSEQIVGLRRAVIEYHATVVDERVAYLNG